MTTFKTSPAFRFGLRTLVIAALTYALAAYKEGISDWRSFAGGLAVAAGYALVGLLTPLEPFVGNKTTVEVPSPPAVKSRPTTLVKRSIR